MPVSDPDRQMGVTIAANHYVEIRLLRYVIAVAEELHFARASGRLNLSPPSLSRQIKGLEQVLGYLLFERRTRDVMLTPAGVAFVTEARAALIHVNRAIESGYAASRGDTSTLEVGYSPWLRPSLLLSVQRHFAERLPQARILLHSVYAARQVDLLLRGTLQVGIVELPILSEGLHTHRVWHDELVAALPARHPHLDSAQVTGSDFAKLPVIWMARSLHASLYEYLMESFGKLGYCLQIVHEVSTVPEMLDLVAAGVGIGFVKKSLAANAHEQGVIFREFDVPKLSIETGVAYRRDNKSEALRVFVQLLRESNSQPPTSTSCSTVESI